MHRLERFLTDYAHVLLSENKRLHSAFSKCTKFSHVSPCAYMRVNMACRAGSTPKVWSQQPWCERRARIPSMDNLAAQVYYTLRLNKGHMTWAGCCLSVPWASVQANAQAN